MIDFMVHDECCSESFHEAVTAGTLGDAWTCPICGCEWIAEMKGSIREWKSNETFILIRMRG